jgi:hypothetical protein
LLCLLEITNVTNVTFYPVWQSLLALYEHVDSPSVGDNLTKERDRTEESVLQSWLLFLYKVPHQPSSHRVYVWRKLKRLGAVLLHDSVWALPMSSRSLAQFQELAAEIANLGGDSLLWEARLAVGIQDKTLVQSLLAQVEPDIAEDPAHLSG